MFDIERGFDNNNHRENISHDDALEKQNQPTEDKGKELYDIEDWSIEAIDWRKREIDRAVQYMVETERNLYEKDEEPPRRTREDIESGKFYYNILTSREEALCDLLDKITGFFIDRPPLEYCELFESRIPGAEKDPRIALIKYAVQKLKEEFDKFDKEQKEKGNL
jgi:hypothetical protein